MTDVWGYIGMVMMGVALGMLGSGGSIFTIPILVYLFGMGAVAAATHSLFIVGLTALLGAVRHMVKGLVEVKVAIFFAVPGLIGMYVARDLLLPSLPDVFFTFFFIKLTKDVFIMFVFSVLMLMSAFSMFQKRHLRADENVRFPPYLILMAQGITVGFATGFVGIGGGFLIVPVLVHLLDLPMKTAVGTSLLIIAINALSGFSMSYLNDHNVIDFQFAGGIIAAAVVGLVIGIGISKIILEDTLKGIFAVLVLLIGLVVFFDQIRRLFVF